MNQSSPSFIPAATDDGGYFDMIDADMLMGLNFSVGGNSLPFDEGIDFGRSGLSPVPNQPSVVDYDTGVYNSLQGDGVNVPMDSTTPLQFDEFMAAMHNDMSLPLPGSDDIAWPWVEREREVAVDRVSSVSSNDNVNDRSMSTLETPSPKKARKDSPLPIVLPMPLPVPVHVHNTAPMPISTPIATTTTTATRTTITWTTPVQTTRNTNNGTRRRNVQAVPTPTTPPQQPTPAPVQVIAVQEEHPAPRGGNRGPHRAREEKADATNTVVAGTYFREAKDEGYDLRDVLNHAYRRAIFPGVERNPAVTALHAKYLPQARYVSREVIKCLIPVYQAAYPPQCGGSWNGYDRFAREMLGITLEPGKKIAANNILIGDAITICAALHELDSDLFQIIHF